MTDGERLDLIATEAGFFERYTGAFDRGDLQAAWDREVSGDDVLLPKTIVHVISGNTPHALHQTLLNGLILGGRNLLKLPSGVFEYFQVPDWMKAFVEISHDLPEEWIPSADALVVYGSDATLRHFQTQCPLETTFVGHGHRVGIAIINDPSPEAAELAARDIGEFNQQGCLSLQTIFLESPRDFAPLLAEAMASYEALNPRGTLAASEAGAISNLREEYRYLAAQDPGYLLQESPGSTAWTIICEDSPTLSLSPGNRTVFLRPMPSDFSSMRHLSGVGLHPFTDPPDLPAPRIFQLGQAQSPPALWAHDGLPPLASLIRSRTIG